MSRRLVVLALAVVTACITYRDSAKELRIERAFAAPPQAVCHAWTDAALIKRWFLYNDKGRWVDAPPVQAMSGGSFHWSVVSDRNASDMFSFHGTYRRFQPSRRLAFTWDWDSLPIEGVKPQGSTLVDVRLAGLGATTIVVLRQTGFRTEAARVAHEQGWNRCMDGIAQLLSERQP